MVYKKNWQTVLKRLTQFYSKQGKDKIYAKMDISNPVIEEYSKDSTDLLKTDEEVRYPDINERIDFWDRALSVYCNLEDDSLPQCYLSEFDEGLYGGIVGGEVKFLQNTVPGWVSSMTVPFVKDLDEVKNFRIDEEKNNWYRLYLKQLELFADRAKGKFGIAHLILITGLNFMFEIIGATETLYSILDYPKKAEDAIDFSLRLNIWLQDTFFKTVGLFEGGTCSTLAQWVPGRIVNESVDPFHLTSPEVFEEWGRDALQKIFDHYDGGVLHIHTNGYHLFKNVISLRGLKCIYTGDDISTKPVYERLNEIDSLRGNIPIVATMPYDVFCEKLFKKDLPSNFLYDVKKAPGIKTCNEIMKEVKNYRVAD